MKNARSFLPAGSFVIAFVIALFAVVAADALGCPNCKDSVNTSDPDGLNLARGYFYSILFMLAMPFTLAGSFAAYVWREVRRQKQREVEATTDQVAP
jgi:heme/copper-type cytochrome/quinol oxidase subunit 2